MITLYFGSPGSGKTTAGVRLIHKCYKSKNDGYDHYLANFENTLSVYQPVEGLGTWSPPFNSLYVIDEAGIDYNNRSYKSLKKETIAWLKLHRHYGVDLAFFSQSWEDCDITIRRLADQLWYVRKVGPFTILRKVVKFVYVDKETHQIVDGYEMVPWIYQFLPFPFHRSCFQIFLRKPYYKYFDSYSREELPLPPSMIDQSADKK